VTFQELIAIILSIYFIELLFKKKYQSSDSSLWVSSKINQEEFITLITNACFFLKVLPLRDDLIWIFQSLDTDKDGFITFLEFAAFIKKYLGNNIDFVKIKAPAPADPNGISEEELNFVSAIWDELKVYFDKYDTGKKSFLNQEELKAFVVEVLNESSERELNYIFWNLFRVDSNSNKEVDFLEFVNNSLFRRPSSSTTLARSLFNDSIAIRPRERTL
jgi:Ca2+-binding EF-hand superfamily protein